MTQTGVSASEWRELERLGWPRHGPEPEPPAVTPVLPASDDDAVGELLVDLADAT